MTLSIALLLTAQAASSPSVVAMKEYEACVFREGDRLSVLQEPVETLSRAAATACSEERTHMRSYHRSLPPKLAETSDRVFDSFEREVRSKVELRMLESRLAS